MVVSDRGDAGNGEYLFLFPIPNSKMSMDLLGLYVMYYALFGRKLPIKQEKAFSALPKKGAFGAFTTIRRHNTIPEFPKDIHGCIGYWDPLFQELSRDTLFSHLLEVSYDAVWSDDRRHAFPSLATDPFTKVEMDIMMRPLYRIDPVTGRVEDTGKVFDNQEFGIILQTVERGGGRNRGGKRRLTQKGHRRTGTGTAKRQRGGRKRATYLPKVFENMPWTELLASIKEKAGISSEPFEVYAYRIHQVVVSFSDFFRGRISELFRDISVRSVTTWLFSVMKVESRYLFPYSGSEQGKLTWNETEEVRSIALLGDMYTYMTRYPAVGTVKQKEQLVRVLRSVLQNMDNVSPQALAFLGHILSPLSMKPGPFCKRLEKGLEEAEEEFERPERLIGMRRAGCTMGPTSSGKLSFGPKNSIFAMNWRIQALLRTGQGVPPLLLSRFLSHVKGMISAGLASIETNEIAVAFEAMCYVTQVTETAKLVEVFFPLFMELEKRRTGAEGKFYAFLDGGYRVDITTHVLNGWLSMANDVKEGDRQVV